MTAKKKAAKKKATKKKVAKKKQVTIKTDVKDVHPGGRPTDYKPEYCSIARKMCQLGATDADLAEALGVARKTIYNWKLNYKEFLDATILGKDQADALVELRLFQRATGYDHPETKTFCYKGRIIEHDVINHIPPDFNSMRLWLINRKQQDWKDTKTIAGDDDKPLIPRSIKVVYE